jgi:capsular polysaccharide biosynthesis protein
MFVLGVAEAALWFDPRAGGRPRVTTMLSIKTSRAGNEFGEKSLLYPFVEVRRTPQVGLIMKDAAAEWRGNHYQHSRWEKFPAIYSRRIHNVMLCDTHILYDENSIYTDNLITAKFAHDDAAFEHTAYGHAGIAIEKERTVPHVEHIQEPVIVTSNEGSGTWGHWLVHNFPKIALAREAYPNCKVLVPVSYFVGGYANFGEVLWLLGLKSEEMIGIYPDRRYKLDQAILVDFLYTHSVHPYTIDLFERMGAAMDETGTPVDRMVIERTTPGKRDVTNRSEFLRQMNDSGFTETTLGALPLRQQIAAWRAGREFCSVLGSDLTNIVFGRPGASILAITPAVFHDNFFFDLAEARGMNWNELFCGETTVERSGPTSDFKVDALSLRHFLSGYQRAT